MTSSNKSRIKGLQLRLQVQEQELKECTTEAMRKCVAESIQDTKRQLAELGA